MKMNLTVLMISNQPALVDHIRALLAELGQDMDVLHSTDAFEDEFSTHLNLCLLDATEQREAAFELMARLRKVHPFAGLVCITHPHCMPKRVQAWQSGADLVMDPALGRRGIQAHDAQPAATRSAHTAGLQTSEVAANRLELNSQQRSLSGPDDEVQLTSTEYLLLQSLARAKERTLALWQIYDLLGKTEQTLKKPALEAQLYRLRKKLRDSGAGNQALKAVRLKGYQLCVSIQIR